MKNKQFAAFVGVIILGFIVMTVAHFNGYTNNIHNYNSDEMQMIEPSNVIQVDDNTREFTYQMSQEENAPDCIAFYTSNQYVKAYADGELLYEVHSGNPHFGRTPGSLWNFAELPDDTKVLTVEIKAAYESVQKRTFEMYVGDGSVIYDTILRNSLASERLSLMIFLVGVVLVVYWVITSRRTQIRKSTVYLGTFALIMGLWSYGETNMAELITSNHQASTFSAFVLLMMMPIPFCLFVKDFLEIEKGKTWRVICTFCIINMIVDITLEITEIRDFKETVLGTHILFVATLSYMLIAIIRKWIKEGFTRIIRINVAGIVVLIVASAIDLIGYYMEADNVDAIGKIGFFTYIVLLGIETAVDSLAQIEVGRKAQIYKEMAITDGLTGLFNRNAFNQDVVETTCDNTAIVIFDLNDLKKCNDTLGHAIGDCYISDASEIIMKIFSPYGKCYRIGGDEFACIIEKQKHCNINGMIDKMNRRIEEHNRMDEQLHMAIACGYEIYNYSLDKSLKDTQKRADTAMYVNKKQMKEQGQ